MSECELWCAYLRMMANTLRISFALCTLLLSARYAESGASEQDSPPSLIAYDELAYRDEGDIVFANGRDEHRRLSTQIAEADNLRLWPGGRMPLKIAFSSNDSFLVYEYVKDAMDMINEASCVVVDDWDELDQDYVLVELSDSMGSSVGRQGGVQVVNISSDTTNSGSVAHEMFHALGYGHEHNRMDRDLYITVHFDNIRSEYWPYYTKYVPDGEFTLETLPYDYTSILHVTAFVDPEVAVDVAKPIVTRNDGQTDLGQRSYLTDLDVERLKARYSCDVCKQPGSDNLLFQYPGDCTKYIQCSNGLQFVMDCPTQLHISVQQQRCLYPWQANCTIYY